MISQLEQLEGDIDIALEHLRQKNPEISVFRGTAERDGEPDYELLRKHVEQWVQSHPAEMRDFLEHKKRLIRDNLKQTGADKTNSVRHVMDLPVGLYNVLQVLSPNFLGANKFTPEGKKKMVRTFLKHFPVFQVCEKY